MTQCLNLTRYYFYIVAAISTTYVGCCNNDAIKKKTITYIFYDGSYPCRVDSLLEEHCVAVYPEARSWPRVLIVCGGRGNVGKVFTKIMNF